MLGISGFWGCLRSALGVGLRSWGIEIIIPARDAPNQRKMRPNQPASAIRIGATRLPVREGHGSVAASESCRPSLGICGANKKECSTNGSSFSDLLLHAPIVQQNLMQRRAWRRQQR